ncbi:serine/threonine-protein kinase [Streptomyces sp. TRM 70351]|uniref:serine/threonine-protein kinase n=1 Tax=Streptomyces sp. TRM 70351 TaxID=3116552 RepID=UPI002E7BC172|nr:serine/threonine-protein kinase [Streptomyces sp. TRM 70351]MEE1928003.1 serine/threonine-protein kinase [Streptomyces sp. TRM 70351]
MGENGDTTANADAATDGEKGTGRDDAVSPGPAQSGGAADGAATGRPTRGGSGRRGPAGSGPAKAGSAKGDAAEGEGDAGDAAKTASAAGADAAKADAAKADAAKGDVSDGGRAKADGPDADAAKGGEPRAEAARAEAPKGDTPKADTPKSGAPRTASGKGHGEDGAARAGAAASPAAAKGRETGRLLAGRYRLGAIQGRGGMGTVWRARDEILGRTVAVKELRFPSDIDEEEKRRLITRTLREAKAIARIRSGSAVTVFDVVEEDDRPWIVMELVEGRSLADAIREDGPVSPRRAAEIGLAILGVLRAAHREGIVHRDVKPSNVLIEEDTGRVVLTDFGIAKVEGDPSVTSTGMLVGAPSYISPERARGQLPGPPADMWSLGGLLYAAVEGHPPYDKGSAIATLTAVMTDPLEPPQRAGELEEVIYGLLVKDPVKRLDDAGARVLMQAVLDAPDEKDLAPRGAATFAMPLPAGDAERKPGDASSVPPRQTSATAAGAAGAASGPGQRPAAAFGSLSLGRRGDARDDGGEGEPQNTRQTGFVIAAVVVLLVGVLGAILAFALNGDDVSGGSGKDDSASASGGTGGQQDGDGKDGDGKDGGAPNGESGDGGAGAEGTGGGDAAQGGAGDGQDGSDGAGGDDAGGDGGGDEQPDGGVPAGYETVSDDLFHFSVALPEGWSRVEIRGQKSGGLYAADLGSVPSVQVDYSDSPKSDALLAWQKLEDAVRGTFTDYRQLSMKPVEWRDYPTVADWQFEHTRGGERMRSLNRGFRVDDGRGHAIVVTCKAAEWDGEECTTLRETVFETFQPVD